MEENADRENLLETDAPVLLAKAVPLNSLKDAPAKRISTGIAELDRVVGDGLVEGSVVLVGGEPGIGKSTLSLQLAQGVESSGHRILYVSAEESLEQLQLRAMRLGAAGGNILGLSETRIENLSRPWKELNPKMVIVDSVQAMRSERVPSAPGSVTQVRESAALLAATAKSQGSILVLIGHVTKDGNLAGPRVLEHLVDVVLLFEGDRGHGFRLLRSVKNRFGSTQEIGVFSMGETGLEGVENPSAYFLSDRSIGAPGATVVPLIEGSRPVLVEVQALVAPAGYGTSRRTNVGVDDGRVALVLAVLDRRTKMDFVSRDVYLNATGGARISEPAADLGLALALASSRLDRVLPHDVAACGEVGLGGELRSASRLEARAGEAARLGFKRLLVPARKKMPSVQGIELVPFSNIIEAISWLRSEGLTASVSATAVTD